MYGEWKNFMFNNRMLSFVSFSDKRRADKNLYVLACNVYKTDKDCPWHKFAKAGFPFNELSKERASDICEYALIKFLAAQADAPAK